MEKPDVRHAKLCLEYIIKQAKAGVKITGEGHDMDIDNNVKVVEEFCDMESLLRIYEDGHDVGYDDLLPCSMQKTCPYHPAAEPREWKAWQDGYDQGVQDS